MFEQVLLVLLLLADVLCWYEARRSGNFMSKYLDQRKAWYEQRNRKKEMQSMLQDVKTSSVAGNTET